MRVCGFTLGWAGWNSDSLPFKRKENSRNANAMFLPKCFCPLKGNFRKQLRDIWGQMFSVGHGGGAEQSDLFKIYVISCTQKRSRMTLQCPRKVREWLYNTLETLENDFTMPQKSFRHCKGITITFPRAKNALRLFYIDKNISD